MVKLKSIINDMHRGIDNPLMGCIRRNIWTQNSPPSAFQVHRNCFLDTFAKRNEISTPIGKLGIWLHDGTVIDVFGGDYRGWWEEDMVKAWCLAKRFTGMSMNNYVYIIQFIRDQVEIYSPVIAETQLKDVTIDIISSQVIDGAMSDPPLRIAKNQQRAYITCKRCPVKRQCDTADSLTPQGKADWGKSYPFP